MTQEQAILKQEALNAFGAMLANAAWKNELVPLLEKKQKEHLNGCTSMCSSPEKRAEHVEAYHLAKELLAFGDSHVVRLKRELADFYKTAARDSDILAFSSTGT